MKKFSTIILSMCIAMSMYGQQDAIFTKYMFSSLTFNPAYAGAEDHLSMGLLHRTQWFGYTGRGTPQSQTLNVHTPLKNERVGVGLNLNNDIIGPTNTISGNIAYAYRIPMGKCKLAIGLQGGGQYYNYDPSQLTIQEVNDYALATPYSRFLPNFGFGLYFSKEKKFYIGVGVPKLIEWDLREKNATATPAPKDDYRAREFRHYFFTAGGAIPLNGDALIFKPSIMVRNVGLLSGLNKDANYQETGAPNSFDIDLSLFFYQQLWLGAAYRSSFEQFNGKSSFSSVNAFMAYSLKNGSRIGLAYDYPITKQKAAGQGSFEIFVGHEMAYRVNKVVTPRYF